MNNLCCYTTKQKKRSKSKDCSYHAFYQHLHQRIQHAASAQNALMAHYHYSDPTQAMLLASRTQYLALRTSHSHSLSYIYPTTLRRTTPRNSFYTIRLFLALASFLLNTKFIFIILMVVFMGLRVGTHTTKLFISRFSRFHLFTSVLLNARTSVRPELCRLR